jgi:hypothetical protein
VEINSGNVAKLMISQQPSSPVNGNYDDQPASLGTYIITGLDAFDNPTTAGLLPGQMVYATIENDGSLLSDAVLSGTTSVSMGSGSATFSNLAINKEGTNYTLRFYSTLPLNLAPVISQPFNVQNIRDLSDFVIVANNTQYQDIPFQVQINNAVNASGISLNGLINVQISSSLEGGIYNQFIPFTAGSAELTLLLEDLGWHNLVFTVEGVATTQILEVELKTDLSGFTALPVPDNQHAGIPFTISLQGAINRDGVVGAAARVVISSDQPDQEVFNAIVSNFDENGNVDLPITLYHVSDPASHLLTITIDNITETQTVSVVVEESASNFTVNAPATMLAGDILVINLTEAYNAFGDLTGEFRIQVTSDQDGIVFNEKVLFNQGAANVDVILSKAALHNLLISVETVIPTREISITVGVNDATALLITQQPTGATGSFSGTTNTGTVIVRTIDKAGNFSIRGLPSTQNVVVTIDYDASQAGAVLAGTRTRNISNSTGTATFNNLTLNKDGEGYILRFSSPFPIEMDPVFTHPFDMINVEDQSNFKIADPGPQVVDQNFQVTFYDATNKDGSLRNGAYNVLISYPPLNIIYNANCNFENGQGTVSASFSESGEFATNFMIENHSKSVKTVNIFVEYDDYSGFSADLATAQYAGTPFSLQIKDAHDKAGFTIHNQRRLVTIASNQPTEGNAGVLFRDSVLFNEGDAIINDLVFSVLGTHNITVSIDWVTEPVMIGGIEVNPGDAALFVITTQPGGGVGNFDNTPVSTGEVVLHVTDIFGHLTMRGISGNVSATQADGPSAQLGGTTTINLVGGVATFNDLTLDKNGTFSISLSFDAHPEIDPVVSNSFVMSNVEDVSGFVVTTDPAPLYENIAFNFYISNARYPNGDLLNGSVNVTLTSNLDGVFFDEALSFNNGNADPINTLFEEAATHEITIQVAGVSSTQVLTVVINSDLSDLAPLTTNPSEGPFYQNYPFELIISGAIARDGQLLNGNHQVIIRSDVAGEEIIFNDVLNFNEGVVTHELLLPSVTEYNLLVEIQNIKVTQEITLEVLSNQSGFSAQLENEVAKIAGVNFTISITDAFGLNGTELEGNHWVRVISHLSETVYDTNTNFTLGVANVVLNLELAQSHNLTIHIDGITVEKVVENVLVLPALISEIRILQQPVGGTGQSNQQPVLVGNIEVRTYDAFGNASTSGLDENSLVSAAIFYDPSQGAQLGGTTSVSISEGIATFDNLTIDKEGTGYILTISLDALQVITDAFDISGIDFTYTVSVDVDGVLDLGTRTEEYEALAPHEITVTRTGTGPITNMNAVLSGTDGMHFTLDITNLEDAILDESNPSVIFTIVPNTELTPGLYEAEVFFTADNQISESFGVTFEVLAFNYQITLTPAGNIDLGLESIGYAALTPFEVRISNIGTGTITNLSVSMNEGTSSNFIIEGPLSGNLPGSDYTLFTVSPQTGLPVGNYSESFTVSGDQIDNVVVGVSFRVVNEVIWVGQTTNWHTASNWSTGTVPGTVEYVVIPASPTGGNFPVISGANVTAYNLTIEPGAELKVESLYRLTIDQNGKFTIGNNAHVIIPGTLRIQSGAVMTLRPGAKLTCTGSLLNNAGVDGLILESSSHSLSASLIHNSSGVLATVQRWMSGRVEHVISPPVSGDDLNDFLTRNRISRNNSLQVFACQVYNENGGWSSYFPFSVSGKLEMGKAYAIRFGATVGEIINFKGTLHHSTYAKTLSREVFGWNGVGNPFASSLGVTEAVNGFISANASSLDPDYAGIWIYDPAISGYRIINNVPQEGSYNQNYIALAQGFIIKAKEPGSVITFGPAMRSHETGIFLKNEPVSEPWYNIRLAAGHSGKNINTYIAFNQNMTTGLDVTFDAGVYNPDPAFTLFTRMPDKNNDLNLSVQALPLMENLQIPVGLIFPAGGNVVFSAASLNLPQGYDALFEDRELDVFTNLADENYQVDLSGTNSTGRFYIHLKKQAATHHEVWFAIETSAEYGQILAVVDDAFIQSGALIQEGKNVVFKAIPAQGYKMSHWVVNGIPVKNFSETEYFFDNIRSVLEVKVVFEKIVTVEVEKIEAEQFRIYSTDQKIYIHGNVSKNTNAILFDMLGRRMMNIRLQHSDTNTIDVEGLVKGVYILQLTGRDTNYSVRVLVQ